MVPSRFNVPTIQVEMGTWDLLEMVFEHSESSCPSLREVEMGQTLGIFMRISSSDVIPN